jgi:hypothetical protein
MQVLPYRLLSGSVLHRIEQLLRPSVDDWADAFGLERPSLAIECQRACDAVSPASDRLWQRSWSGLHGRVWVDWNDGFLPELANRMFAPDRSHAPVRRAPVLGSKVAAGAFDELVQALRSACVDGQHAATALGNPGPELWKQYSGAALVAIRLGRSTIRLLLDDACVRRFAAQAAVPPQPALAPVRLRDAVSAIPVSLQVQAGLASLGAGTLLGVGVGDVIRLATPVDGAFDLSMPSGVNICRAFIGRQGEHFAVEVLNSK